MSDSILVRNWLTMKGPGGGTAVTFFPHRSQWLATRDYGGAVISIEVPEITGATTPPTLTLETAVGEDGPWTAVASYTTTGDRLVYLRRDPAGTAAQHLAGLFRWKIAEGTGAWTVCFRVTAILEPLVK